MPNENENIIQLNREDPMANKLRQSVANACGQPSANQRPVLVQADAQGNIKAQPPQEVKLTPFDNGMLFAYSPNPKKPGTCFIHDAAGVNVALAVSEEIANILCRGAHLFFQVAQKQIEEAKAKEAAADKVAETVAAPVTEAPYCEELDSPSPEAGK